MSLEGQRAKTNWDRLLYFVHCICLGVSRQLIANG